MITQEQFEKKVDRYLTETSKHLFKVDGSETYYKVFTYKRDKEKYYITISTGTLPKVTISKLYARYDSDFQSMKHQLFPVNEKRMAIPHWKGHDEEYEGIFERIKELDFKEIRFNCYYGHILRDETA